MTETRQPAFTAKELRQMADRLERRRTEVGSLGGQYHPDSTIVDSAQAVIIGRMLRYAADVIEGK